MYFQSVTQATPKKNTASPPNKGLWVTSVDAPPLSHRTLVG